MIGAGKADQMGAAGVITGKPHRLHHRFSAGHVEGDFVEAGNLAQPPDIVGDNGMIGAKHGPKRVGALLGILDALLIEVVAEDVDAVGAGEVVEHVAVEIGDGDPGRGLDEAAGTEILADQTAVLERHPVGLGELQVRDLLCRFSGRLPAAREALLVKSGETEEAVLTSVGDLRRRAIGAEEIIDVEFVMRHQPRDHLGHFGMSGQRAMLGARQRQSGLQFRDSYRSAGNRGGGQRENRERRIHASSANVIC